MERRGACVAFGSFEFVHRGHLKVAKKVVELANRHHLETVILSIPAKGEVFTTEKEKAYLFRKAGIEKIITYEGKTALTNIVSYMKTKLQAERVVVGEDFGELEELCTLAKKFEIHVELVKKVCHDERVITRAWLKEVFEANDFELLEKICGHPYVIIGDVVHGKKIGRTVGMPTINLHIYKTKRRPNCGVYATKVVLEDKTYLSATNIGRRPTVDDFEYVTIETFILDFNEQIYGEVCILEVHKFLREVQKFESLEEVHEQVQKDVVLVREMFREV